MLFQSRINIVMASGVVSTQRLLTFVKIFIQIDSSFIISLGFTTQNTDEEANYSQVVKCNFVPMCMI